MLGPYLQEMLEKHMITFIHGEVEVITWKILQAREICSKDSRWAKDTQVSITLSSGLIPQV